MSSTYLLEKLGIYGWERIEPVLLAALLAEEPILLIGRHGGNKTDGTKQISQGVLGLDANYVKYEAPVIQPDDILGYIDVRAMAEGKVNYLETPVSLWGADAIGLDELNRANPMTAAKLMEAIRTKQLMGMKTKIKLVFAMVNPPKEYDSIYMDLALTSRFSCIRVPSAEDMDGDTLLKIIRAEPPQEAGFREFHTWFHEVKEVTFTSEDKDQVAKLVASFAGKLGVAVEPRELKSLYRLILAAYKLRKKGYPVTEATLADIVLSKIPQVWDITRHHADVAKIQAAILVQITGFVLNDPLTKATTLESVLNAPNKDILAWSTSLIKMIPKEADPEKLRSLHRQLVNMGINKDIVNNCTQAAVIRLLEMKQATIPETKLSWDRAEVKSMLRGLLT
jgi:MoxR-like ATPase